MTIVRARWFPASVVLPDEPQPWQRCYVIAADDGLHVWRRRSEVADWHSAVIWPLTTLPATDRAAHRGFDVNTEAGLVVVTLGSGCRCGAMGHWKGPAWSNVEQVRV